jgi:ribosome-associated heat shock protein Hsp15
VRIDVWLWAVRLFKSRSAAAEALRSGKVHIGDKIAKPATLVAIGDRIRWREPLRERQVEVVQLLPKRVGAPLAAAAYIDHSPPIPPKELLMGVGLRDPHTGRPTKRERREIDRLRGERRG